MRIGILGVGGIGGYVGGKLVARYSGRGGIEIVFITRGENEKAIQAQGLKLITSDGEVLVRPSVVTSMPERCGTLDLLLCCVKSYDLESAISSFQTCLTNDSIILPLLNGVDAAARIRSLLPSMNPWEGCIYLVSRLVEPGIVKQSGTINQLFFGSSNGPDERIQHIEQVFISAGINARASVNITQTLWEKFLFISPIATLTSYLDLSIPEIIDNNEHKALLLELLAELKKIADTKKIILSENIIQKHFEKAASMQPGATSSMHNDFQKRGKTELDSLTGYVVKIGKELNIPTPHYAGMWEALSKKTKSTG